MNTQENNKLIAEFMGFTYEKNIGWYDNEMLMSQDVYDNQDGNCFDELKFHSSWDWLMPVVEKCFQTGDDTHEWDNIMDTLFTCDREIVYAQVVEFIKQYNNQSNNQIKC